VFQYYVDVCVVSLLNCAICTMLMIVNTCQSLLRLCIQWSFSHLWSTLAMGAAVYFDLYSGMCPIPYRTGETLLADQQCLLSRLAAGFGLLVIIWECEECFWSWLPLCWSDGTWAKGTALQRYQRCHAQAGVSSACITAKALDAESCYWPSCLVDVLLHGGKAQMCNSPKIMAVPCFCTFLVAVGILWQHLSQVIMCSLAKHADQL